MLIKDVWSFFFYCSKLLIMMLTSENVKPSLIFGFSDCGCESVHVCVRVCVFVRVHVERD